MVKEVIYSKFSNERRKEFQIHTDIVRNEQGVQQVYKYAIRQEGQAHLKHLCRVYEALRENYKSPKVVICESHMEKDAVVSPFVEGLTLQEHMENLISIGEEEKVEALIQEYIAWIKEDGGEVTFVPTTDFEEVFGAVDLPEHLVSANISDIDLIFSNLILKDRKWNVIDYEWTFSFPIPKNYILYRALFLAYHQIGHCRTLSFSNMMEMAGITEQEITAYEKMEQHFQEYVMAGAFPMREMMQRVGTKIWPVQTLLQAKENPKVLVTETVKIRYHIDRLEYQAGVVICCGWAYGIGNNKVPYAVELAVKDAQGHPVRIAAEQSLRPDILEKTGKEALKLGFNISWSGVQQETYDLIFSCGNTVKKIALTETLAQDGVAQKIVGKAQRIKDRLTL